MKAFTWEKALDEAYPMVEKLARKHKKNCHGFLDINDLINAGLEGLYDAFNRFENTGHTTFSTYARFRINGSIVDEIRRHANLSRRTFDKVKAVEKFQNKFFKLQGRMPTTKEVEDEFEGKIADIKSACKGRVYVFSRNDADDRVDENHPEGQMEFYDIALKLKSLLPEKNYSMLIMKNFEGLTLKEIAKVYKISEARVSQLIKESIGLLEDHLDVV